MEARNTWDADQAAAIIATHANREGPTLVVLQALQEAFGHVPEAAIPLVANALNLSRAEVHGVFTFYHDLRDKPAGKHVLKLCRAEACQAAGCDDLVAHAESKLGVAMGGTTADGRLTLEPVYCLGLCATGPNAMVDDMPLSRLDAASLDRIAAKVGA